MQAPASHAQERTQPGVVQRAQRITPLIQRQADTGGEPAVATGEETEEDLERLEASNEGPIAQRKAESGSTEESDGDSTDLDAARSQRSGGAPLDADTRSFMESRFGHDFSHVRIHTDSLAHRAAQTIQARAFTIGKDIWFAQGQYSPGSSSARHLLAHELTHTIQQGGSIGGPQASRAIQRSFCPSSCETPISEGRTCRASEVTRDGCGERAEIDPDKKISHIRVVLTDRKVTLFWDGRPNTAEGTSEEVDCTPNESTTPKGWDKVGIKCGINHTSYERFNMAWFTAFKSTGMRIGFHDSQPLGAAFHSHGCVRVSCENAEKINKNTRSDWTSIIVR